MRYWVYMNNQVSGPVEKEKLPGLPGFGPATLVSPETPAGGEAAGWKEASVYQELAAAFAAGQAPAQPRRPAESPIAMTMRGTLIEDQVSDAPAPGPSPVFSPAPEKAAAPAAQPLKERGEPAAEPELGQRLGQLSAMLVSIGNTQSQLLERLGRVENAVSELKALLFQQPPK